MNADEHREPESLELNKETLQDLDVESNAAEVKGGALEVRAISDPVPWKGYTPPTLNQQTAACTSGVMLSR
jgi:hypothetical protein